MYILAAAAIWMGPVLLVEAGVYVGVLSYDELAKLFHGRWGSLSIDAAIVVSHVPSCNIRGLTCSDSSQLLSLGAIISVLLVMGELASEILTTWTGNGQWSVNTMLVTVLLVVFFVLPVCMVRQLGHLVWVAAVSFTAISAVVLLVVVGAPFEASAHADEPLYWFEPLGALTSMGSIVFAFSYAQSTFLAYASLRPRTAGGVRVRFACQVLVSVYLKYGISVINTSLTRSCVAERDFQIYNNWRNNVLYHGSYRVHFLQVCLVQ
jgi:amino acid permease